jgi:uncharacterized protein (TIRG00374 family)
MGNNIKNSRSLLSKILKSLTKFLGVFIFGFILFRTNWGKFKSLFEGIGLAELIPIYLLLIPTNFIACLRWHYLLEKVSIKRSFFQNTKLYFTGILMGIITPGRVGELYPVIRLGREGHSKAKSGFMVVLSRLFDFGFLLILAIIAVYNFLDLRISNSGTIKLILWLILAFLFVFMIVIFVSKQFMSEKIALITRKIFKIDIDKDSVDDFMNKIDIRLFFNSGLLTISFWVLYFFQLYLFIRMLGVQIPFISMLLILALVSLAAALPITLVGLGTREFAMINLLALFSVGREKALAVSLMSYTFMLVSILAATVFWIIEHRKD